MQYSFCDSAHGPLLIAIDRDGLRYVEFVLGSSR
jgi:methylated-DNA-[protein]-cysteine S-methyltransferase